MPTRMLIVDDEPDLAETISELMEGVVDEIKSATNGREALDILEKENFDVVISDYNMPQLNGLELLKTLREKQIFVPVIWISGKADEKIFREAWQWGAFEYFPKPYETSALKQAVRSALSFGNDFKNQSELKRLSNDSLIQQSVVLPAGLHEALETLAKTRQVSVSTLIATLLESGLEQIPDAPTIRRSRKAKS